MLGVLPVVEDPDLSWSAAPALPQHLPPCTTFIWIPATTASEKSSGAREHQNQAMERVKAGGGGCGAIAD